MENKEREFVESFCAHIKKRDAWLWGDTAKYILANIDYTARALLIENGNEYFVTCYLKDGRIVELQKRETGFGCKWESPEEKEKRESQWPDDGLNHFTQANTACTGLAPTGAQVGEGSTGASQ